MTLQNPGSKGGPTLSTSIPLAAKASNVNRDAGELSHHELSTINAAFSARFGGKRSTQSTFIVHSKFYIL